MRYLTTILISFFVVSAVFSQNDLSTDDKKALTYFENAMQYYRNNQLESAENSYKMAIERDSNFVEAYLELGLFYGETKNYEKAVSTLTRAKAINREKYPTIYYYIGLFELNQGHYDAAKSSIKEYLTFNYYDQKKTENAERMLQKCEFALRNVAQKVDFKPVNMGREINSMFSELYKFQNFRN